MGIAKQQEKLPRLIHMPSWNLAGKSANDFKQTTKQQLKEEINCKLYLSQDWIKKYNSYLLLFIFFNSSNQKKLNDRYIWDLGFNWNLHQLTWWWKHTTQG